MTGSLSERIAARQTCANNHCDRAPAFPETTLCTPCYEGLRDTGRLPVVEAVWVPEWRRRDLARDESGRNVA